jgi:L-amino acid N-acyltransferase YncA
VAVTKRKPKTGRQNWVEDWIVGFASIDDFCDKGSMYRFTFELEMYVHRGWLHKGIATCLMDRLLSTVNTGYHEKGGYVWENYGEYLKGDAERRVKIINASVPHDEGEDMAWMTKFFHKFDFTKKGHLSKMGYKNGKV